MAGRGDGSGSGLVRLHDGVEFAVGVVLNGVGRQAGDDPVQPVWTVRPIGCWRVGLNDRARFRCPGKNNLTFNSYVCINRA